ncbi:hypothetical protein D3C87_1038380 [compost metagenome]
MEVPKFSLKTKFTATPPRHLISTRRGSVRSAAICSAVAMLWPARIAAMNTNIYQQASSQHHTAGCDLRALLECQTRLCDCLGNPRVSKEAGAFSAGCGALHTGERAHVGLRGVQVHKVLVHEAMPLSLSLPLRDTFRDLTVRSGAHSRNAAACRRAVVAAKTEVFWSSRYARSARPSPRCADPDGRLNAKFC